MTFTWLSFGGMDVVPRRWNGDGGDGQSLPTISQFLRAMTMFESSGISKFLCAMTDFQHGAAAEGI
jgi:hypothetical protein